MKRLLVLGFVCVFSCCLHAQAVDTTVCEILKNPASFNGKILKIKGTVTAGFDQFVVKGEGCGVHVSDIWLAYPEGTKAKAGPAAVLEMQPAQNYTGTVAPEQRTAVVLDKSKDFKQFDSLLATPAKSAAMCLGCPRYDVSATMVGRLDGVAKAGVIRDKAGKIQSWSGFGNLNAYSARLVLQSVADVTPKEVDYSKTASLKDDNTITANGTDPIVANRNAVKAFGAGTAAGDQIGRAADAFGKEGEKAGANGVFMVSGNLNEAAAKDEAKGSHPSPDGILFNVGFNSNRLSGDAMVRAVAHMGQHVADLRDPEKGFEEAGIYELEFRGWSATSLSIMAYGQKILTLPGGYVLWNAAWPAADRNANVTDSIKGYLGTEELLSR
jgi:hypothetical protein